MSAYVRTSRPDRLWQLTESSDDLGFQLVLALESTRNVGNVTPTIVSSIGYVADRVEHVARGVDQNEADTEECQNLAVRNNRLNVRPDGDHRRNSTHDGDNRSDNLEPFGRPVNRRVGPTRCLTSNPCLNRLRARFSEVMG